MKNPREAIGGEEGFRADLFPEVKSVGGCGGGGDSCGGGRELADIVAYSRWQHSRNPIG